MVKLHGPMFSLGASGTIGDAVTFASWKGRAYARERVIPSNPMSGPQVGMRAMMKFLAQAWDALGAPAKASWVLRAASSNISPFNAYVGYNQARWRSFAGPTQDFPAAEAHAGGDAPTTTATGGIHQAQLSIVDGATPPTSGWFIYRSDVTGFTPGYDNLVAVVHRVGTPTVFIDAGLVAGVYYYRIGGFSDDGKKGVLEAQTTATVT